MRLVGRKASGSGVGVWFTLPESGINVRRPFWLKASFAGFKDPGLLVASEEPEEVNIGYDPNRPELWDPHAHCLFTHPESRRFLYLLGGDHLERGRANLETISNDYRMTIYAPYANLALGVAWARHFHGLKEGTVFLRKPDPVRAAEYLRRANERRDLLSASYQRLLDGMLRLNSEERPSKGR